MHKRQRKEDEESDKNRMRSISAQLSSSTPSIIASLSSTIIRKDSSVIVIDDATEAR